MNHLQAQALKAELMGDMERYDELQEKIHRIETKPRTEVIVLEGLGMDKILPIKTRKRKEGKEEKKIKKGEESFTLSFH